CISFPTTLRPPRRTLFPYTTLFRSQAKHEREPTRVVLGGAERHAGPEEPGDRKRRGERHRERGDAADEELPGDASGKRGARDARDRKSTRLNSSHSQISYAVFCLKK